MGRLAAVLVGAVLLAACAGTSAPASECDTAALQDEVHHILMDSGLEVASFDAFTCEQAWAVVQATLRQSDGSSAAETFLLHHDVDIWVLRPTEIACVEERLPDVVRAAACP